LHAHIILYIQYMKPCGVSSVEVFLCEDKGKASLISPFQIVN